MAKLLDLIKSLITELINSQLPGAFLEDGVPIFSGFVSAGNGRWLSLSRSMEELIIEISRVLKQNHQTARQAYTDDEWRSLVRTSLGPVLASIVLDEDIDENAQSVLTDLKEVLKKAVVPGPREYSFGCTMFGNDLPPFTIGPVRIETRLDWLTRKECDGGVPKTSARRIRRIWAGERLKKRKKPLEEMIERSFLDGIGKCNYVCSVTLSGFGQAAGTLRAQTAARLAITSVALAWELPSSALDGFNLLIDGSPRRQRQLLFVPGQRILAGHSLKGLPHGPTIPLNEWNSTLKTYENILTTAGEVINFYLDPTGAVARPKLMNSFLHALFWFHEACREEVDLAAIVNFAATLDALANGKESAGIMQLIKARLGPDKYQAIRPNGQTTKQAVEEIYSQGRSRTIHGTNEIFGHDWSSTRRFGEAIARLCLVSCFDFAGTGINDDPELLRK
jgi:hypothetical protein